MYERKEGETPGLATPSEVSEENPLSLTDPAIFTSRPSSVGGLEKLKAFRDRSKPGSVYTLSELRDVMVSAQSPSSVGIVPVTKLSETRNPFRSSWPS